MADKHFLPKSNQMKIRIVAMNIRDVPFLDMLGFLEWVTSVKNFLIAYGASDQRFFAALIVIWVMLIF